MLPQQAYSVDPPSFSVPNVSQSFRYMSSDSPVSCGDVYCFDGSGYSFQAENFSQFTAALRSNVFDSYIRAVVISFSLYSPSLRAVFRGSYLAEILPTGNVLGSFDAFVFDYADALGMDNQLMDWGKLLWAFKIMVLTDFFLLFEVISLASCRFYFALFATLYRSS
jgi:hypothetical protein